ncbi:MAG: glycosyl transferase 2 family protein [Solirubrobacteraceae bacterium]|nr:glycosyl transferase 2 family protein [Solirubrobacteraceae bacterium]
MTVDVSVITPVLNEERHVASTYASMRAQRFDGEIEFIFADGGSTDRTRELLDGFAREDPRVRVIENPARQIAAGLNVALRASRAPVVARMDAHTLYPPDYLAVGVARLRRGDVVWASGPQLPHGVDPGSRRIALALGSRLGTGGANFRHAADGETDGLTGFTGVFDKATLDALGGWDEGWPVNEDSELGARILERGGRIVILPEMAAQYIPRSTMVTLSRQYRRYGFYREKTCRHHPGTMRLSHLLPPAIAVTAVAALVAPRPVRTPSRVGLSAYAATVALAGAAAAREAPAAEAAGVPAALAVMHLSWGAGFLAGCLRWGPPFAGTWRVVRGLLRV